MTDTERSIPLLAIGLLLVLLLIVGALASIPFLARERAPAVGSAEPVVFDNELGRIRAVGDIELLEPGVVRIRLDLGAAGDRMIPQLILDMPEHATMGPLRPAVDRLPDGRFEAIETLPMSGYWLLRIDASEGWTDIGFRLLDSH